MLVLQPRNERQVYEAGGMLLLLFMTRRTSSPKLHFEFCKRLTVLGSDLTRLPLAQKS